MFGNLFELIATVAELILDIMFWKKTNKRRKFEKENNLPKSIVWHPLTKPILYFFLIITPISFIFFFIFNSYGTKKKTVDKMNQITILLKAEKEQFKKYPIKLKEIVRNNPFRQKLTTDAWENNFIYELSKDSLNYTLISLGKDQKINTTDDIVIKSN